jgi:hypothetical protein
MNGVVELRLIGAVDEIAAVLALLQSAATGTGARVVSGDQPYRSRRDPAAVRVYAQVILPAGLPDEGVR